MPITSVYEKDFYAWVLQNAALLKNGRLAEADVEHIAEELETMGKNEKRELLSRLAILIAHLLKWKFQPVKRSKSWKNTIWAQRIDIDQLLEDSPSLRGAITSKIETAYAKAKLIAEDETGIDKSHFPPDCPFSLADMLNDDFFPEV